MKVGEIYMPSINITEYDNTISGPIALDNDNIVAVPINATDGPSDKWITVYPYENFLKIFGGNPNPDSIFGNSWEYAANLLLRGMPVCVRRITNYIDENGINTADLLPGVNTSKAIIKINDIIEKDADYPVDDLINETIDVTDDAFASVLKFSKLGDIENNPNYYGEFHTQYLLESNSKKDFNTLQTGSWANVSDPGYEFVFGGPYVNPNYRGSDFGDNTTDEENVKYTYSDVLNLNMHNHADDTLNGYYSNQITDNSFYVNKDDKTEIKYNSVGTLNSRIHEITYDYPSQIENVINQAVIKDISGLNPFKYDPDLKSTNLDDYYFVEVKNDRLNRPYVTLPLTKLWKYSSSEKTVVLNHKFITKMPALDNISENDIEKLIFPIFDGMKSLNEYIATNQLVLTAGDWAQVKVINDANGRPDYVIKVYQTDGSWKDAVTFVPILSDFYLTFNSKNSIDEIKDFSEYVKTKSNLPTANYLTENFFNHTNPNITIILPVYKNTANEIANQLGFVKCTAVIDEKNAVTWSFSKYDQSKDEKTIYKKLISIPYVRQDDATIGQGNYQRRYYWSLTENTEILKYFRWRQTELVEYTTPTTILTNATRNINKIKITTTSISKSQLSISVNSNPYAIIINPDVTETRIISGIFEIKNPNATPIRIYDLRISKINDVGRSIQIYNANINDSTGGSSIKSKADTITIDGKLTIYNGTEYINNPIPEYDDILNKWYITLNSGDILSYNENISSGTLEFDVLGFGEPTMTSGFGLDVNVNKSNTGRYALHFSSVQDLVTNGDPVTITKYSLLPMTEEEEDNELQNGFDKLNINDGHGYYNLFTVEYRYPGTNGNNLYCKVKVIARQGIYIYVYKNNQFLEKIELASLKYRLENGKIGIYDTELNKDVIWTSILDKFGITLPYNGYAVPTPIVGNYISINLNPNIKNYNTLDYMTSLLAQNNEEKFYLKHGSNPTDEHVQHELTNAYKPLNDKYKYDIKFVSNGGYVDNIVSSSSVLSPISSEFDQRLIEEAMLDVVNTRKDCVTYLDIPYDLAVEDVPTYFEYISSSYAAAYDPWVYIRLQSGGTKWMPPSFAQLYTHAKSILAGNQAYLPPAGVKRALVPEILETNHELDSKYITECDSVQFINPIFYINGFDYTIYGQKTLYNIINANDSYESALQDLNVRLVANTIKKLIFKTCISLTFDLNGILTWNEFKSKISPLLLTMQGEGVITRYSIRMDSSTMTIADLNSGHVRGIISVSVTRAATDWDIDFELRPNEVIYYNDQDYNDLYTEEII